MPAPHHSVFLQAGCPSCRQTNGVKADKVYAYKCMLQQKFGKKFNSWVSMFLSFCQTATTHYTEQCKLWQWPIWPAVYSTCQISPGLMQLCRFRSICLFVYVYVFICTPICWNLPLFCSGDVWTVSEEFLHPIKRLNTREAAQGLCQADRLNSLPVLTL